MTSILLSVTFHLYQFQYYQMLSYQQIPWFYQKMNREGKDFAILIYLYACKSHAIDSLVQVYQLPDPETNIVVSHRTKTPYV